MAKAKQAVNARRPNEKALLLWIDSTVISRAKGKARADGRTLTGWVRQLIVEALKPKGGK